MCVYMCVCVCVLLTLCYWSPRSCKIACFLVQSSVLVLSLYLVSGRCRRSWCQCRIEKVLLFVCVYLYTYECYTCLYYSQCICNWTLSHVCHLHFLSVICYILIHGEVGGGWETIVNGFKTSVYMSCDPVSVMWSNFSCHVIQFLLSCDSEGGGLGGKLLALNKH